MKVRQEVTQLPLGVVLLRLSKHTNVSCTPSKDMHGLQTEGFARPGSSPTYRLVLLCDRCVIATCATGAMRASLPVGWLYADIYLEEGISWMTLNCLLFLQLSAEIHPSWFISSVFEKRRSKDLMAVRFFGRPDQQQSLDWGHVLLLVRQL